MSIFDWLRTKKDETEEEKPTITVHEILDDYVKDFALRGCRSKRSLRSEVRTAGDVLR
jgi:hypothetical protein